MNLFYIQTLFLRQNVQNAQIFNVHIWVLDLLTGLPIRPETFPMTCDREGDRFQNVKKDRIFKVTVLVTLNKWANSDKLLNLCIHNSSL